MDIYQDSICLALEKALEDKSLEPINLIPFLFLKTITKDFSDNEQIGIGGFGAVYRGALRNGVVAVKKLHDNIVILEESFRREVACLLEVKHKNIVRFLGYCSETQHLRTLYKGEYVWANVKQRLFCFEYLSKGSLAKHLTEASPALQWRERYQIIKGICEGVGYLHKHHIIHMDLKPQNILLDDGMVPKIADFGISRRFGENQSRAITENKVGSWGYMAPEFLRSGKITLKADIYSLGVIIMEVLMAPKKYSNNFDNVLESWASTLGTSERHPLLEQVKVCAEIAKNCKDNDPGNRPTIHDIICMLDKIDVSNSSVGSIASTSAGQLVDEVKPTVVSSKIERSVMSRFGQHYLLAQKTCKPMRISASRMPGETTAEVSFSF